jgi:integrase
MQVKKRGKYYWFRFTYKGKLYRQSTKLTNQEKAEDYAAAFRTRLIEGELNLKRKEPAPGFSDAMDSFLDEIKDQHPSSTIERYTAASKPLKAFFKSTTIDQITVENVRAYRKKRTREISETTGRELRPATINVELRLARMLFNYYIDEGKITSNPVSSRRAKRSLFLPENNEQMFVLSHELEEKYLEAAGPTLRDVAIIMLDCGFRPDEVLRIVKENVNFDQGNIENKYGKSKKAKRKVPMTARVTEVMRRRIVAAKGTHLFPSKNNPNKPRSPLSQAHDRLIERAKLPDFRLYDCRHTYGSRSAEAGVDLATLRDLMGHSRIEMTMRYVHVSEEHKAAAVQKLEEYNIKKQEKGSEEKPYLN